MTFTSTTLADFLGQPSQALLASPPFSEWRFTRTVKPDLDNSVNYVCDRMAFEFCADKYDRIETIFLNLNDPNLASLSLDDAPSGLRRADVLERFGTPSKSGPSSRDPILGDYGRWDRFTRKLDVIHFQFDYTRDRIARITLMRPDVAP
jgi:hypothetical protein